MLLTDAVALRAPECRGEESDLNDSPPEQDSTLNAATEMQTRKLLLMRGTPALKLQNIVVPLAHLDGVL